MFKKITILSAILFMLNPLNTYTEPKSTFILNDEVYRMKYITENGVFLYGTEEQEIFEELIEMINSMKIDNHMSDTTKADKVAHFLCSMLTYDKSITKFTGDNYKAFTTWSLATGKAVCAGYADSFQYLCTVLGIECYYEVGHILDENNQPKEYHAWNRIVVDDIDYWYDVCWYDSGENDIYLHSESRWEDRQCEEEWFRYRINGGNYPIDAEN